ncbi:MAG: CinA family nicotinamide mononucleotide deamidase-related protein [Persicimonas sp.]
MDRIAVVCIGDELLDGRVADQNASWLAAELGNRGLRLEQIEVVGDDIDRIVAALEEAAGRADLIVVSGGLGPTSDDRTRQAASRWVDQPLRLDEKRLETLERRFDERGYPFTPNNRTQCTFPQEARILDTEVGTAAGFEVERDETRALFFPGVPSEFRWFMERYVLADIAEDAGRGTQLDLTFFGPGESQLETRLDGIEDLAENLGAAVGYRAAFPHLSVHAIAPDDQARATLRSFILERAGRWLIEEDGEPLSARLGRRLVEREATVTTAESCTAGRVASKLTETPGSSQWFERGFVTYANAAKVEMLGVAPEMLERFGAVSAQTVCQMAAGAARRADATYAVATSGIAGPGGGTAEKPVGTLWVGLAGPEGVWYRKYTFGDRTRKKNLAASVYAALSPLLWLLEERLAEHRFAGPVDLEQVWSDRGVAEIDSESSEDR